MPLNLLVGPANAGKVERLLEQFAAVLDRHPFLVVPNVGDIARLQRDLLDRSDALFAGRVGTFDDLVRELDGAEPARGALSDAERRLLVRSLLDRSELDDFSRSARFGGFVDALVEGFAELESATVKPEQVTGELGSLYALYLERLEQLGLADRELARWLTAERVSAEPDTWPHERPLFVHGFEDLTGAQWRLLDALAARAEVTVALPYEPGRATFSALARTQQELARRAAGRITELPPRSGEYAHPALAFIERRLFEPAGAEAAPPIQGAVRFLEASGSRAAFELVAEEALALLRGGVEAEEIAVICPSLERRRASLETAFSAFGLPYVLEGRVKLAQIPFGHALCGLLRFAWLAGERSDLFSFVRSPYSEVTRSSADFLEGRLRGRAVHSPARIESELAVLRKGRQLSDLELLARGGSAIDALRELSMLMLQRAYGFEGPPASERSRLDLRAFESIRLLLDELERWQGLSGQPLERDDLLAALERAPVRIGSAEEPGRVVVSDLLQTRARRFKAVFLIGLEEGSFPRRSSKHRLLDDEARERLEQEMATPPPAEELERDRFLFYNACTRAYERLFLVRESASEDGSPRQASPFWEELRELFPSAELERWTKRRSLSKLVWDDAGQAPNERERLRSLAALASSQPAQARALARANGWERQLERALHALDRPTRLVNPVVLSELEARGTFSVTELEAFGTCSEMWFVERIVSPREIDGEVDAKLRGSVAHQTLYRFFSGLPKRFGADRVEAGRLDEQLEFLRECLSGAIEGQVRLELDELELRELEAGLWRDLEQFIRSEAASPLPLVPKRFEVGFGSERSAAELKRGLDLGELTVSGKIDRIDLDPFAARGLVQDYKSGRTAQSAAQIEDQFKLQLPLYLLVLRDLIGVEPLGGVYRALAGERPARGILRAEAREDGVPGFSENDYLEEDEFWAKVDWATATARSFAARIRAGDVRHDPLGLDVRPNGAEGSPSEWGRCPSWCRIAPLCRVPRR
ncbi:MAG: PD-(D/E)XK nuclease family protein [Gaiellaceae bacterium]